MAHWQGGDSIEYPLTLGLPLIAPHVDQRQQRSTAAPYGTPVAVRDLGSFRLTEAWFAPHAPVEWHSHEYPHFCLVLAGGYVERSGACRRLCEPHQVIFHPAAERHAGQIASSGARDLCIEVLPAGAAKLGVNSSALADPTVFHDGPAVWCGLRLAEELKGWDVASQLAAEGLILELFAHALRKKICTSAGDAPRWLRTVCDAIRDQLDENLSLAHLAQLAGVHPSHLARVFRRHQGCTPGEYVRRRRLERACRELRQTNQPLAAIALRAGFYDQSHFARVFKKAMGMTPTMFRREGPPR